MSVIMTLRAKGDAKKLEQIAAEEPDRVRSISDAAKPHGVRGNPARSPGCTGRVPPPA